MWRRATVLTPRHPIMRTPGVAARRFMREREALAGRPLAHDFMGDEADASVPRTGFMATATVPQAPDHAAGANGTSTLLRVPCPCHTDIVPGASLPPAVQRQAAEDGVLAYAVSWRDMHAAAHMLGFGTQASA